MSFELKSKDLLGRIGKLRTKSGTIETPLLFPVINTSIRPISPERIKEEFGFQALITNAYILKNRFGSRVFDAGLHKFLDYDGVVMTDSGAYQILIYGDVEVSPREIVEYQEDIGSDIATILDIPTGWDVTESEARKTVKETLKRGREFFELKKRDDILWVGPVQGGKYLDLVADSARKMSKLPFDIHALGSPTEVMERYRFDVLVDMIMTAKMNLPINRPLHLFGAGHPFMLALAVALGCDLFDSAAYALYAKQGRYMTELGTYRIGELDYLPCSCPKCRNTAPKQVLEMEERERKVWLAEHNLYVCTAEMRRIKEAIKEGRLWELVRTRTHGHPSLLNAFKRFGKYKDYIEKFSPSVKTSGLFFFGSTDLARPEIVRYRYRLRQNFVRPRGAKVLLLLPQTVSKPFSRSPRYKSAARLLRKTGHESDVHVCFYCAPFGVVPFELDEVYPLSQHEVSIPLDAETIQYVAERVSEYVSRSGYKRVILLDDDANWGNAILEAVEKTCKKKRIVFSVADGFKQLQGRLSH